MENYYYRFYLIFLLLFISERVYWTVSDPTIVLKTWNVDRVRNPLLFYNFDISFPFGVFIPEKKKASFHRKLQKYSILQASLNKSKHPMKFA